MRASRSVSPISNIRCGRSQDRWRTSAAAQAVREGSGHLPRIGPARRANAKAFLPPRPMIERIVVVHKKTPYDVEELPSAEGLPQGGQASGGSARPMRSRLRSNRARSSSRSTPGGVFLQKPRGPALRGRSSSSTGRPVRESPGPPSPAGRCRRSWPPRPRGPGSRPAVRRGRARAGRRSPSAYGGPAGSSPPAASRGGGPSPRGRSPRGGERARERVGPEARSSSVLPAPVYP